MDKTNDDRMKMLIKIDMLKKLLVNNNFEKNSIF